MKTHFTIATVAGLALLALAGCATPETPAATDTGTPVSVINVPASAAVTLGTAGAASGPALEAGWTRFEAESATFSADAATEAQGFYSAGTAVGSFDSHPVIADLKADWSNASFVKFSLPNLTAGTYDVRIAYNGDDDKVILVSGNGSTPAQVSLPAITAGHDWNQLLQKTLTATFSAGTNSFWVSGTVKTDAAVADAKWANFDYIEIKKQ